MYGLPGRPGAVVPHNRARRCTIRCSLPWEQNCRRSAMCRQPANPLHSGKHGRPRRVADRAASRGAVERCGAALRGHARDSFVGTGEPHSGRQARPPCGERAERRREVPSPRAASAASSNDLGARSIEIFQEAIQSKAESSPQVSRM